MLGSLFHLSSYALGLIFIILVAIIWSVASIVVQYLYGQSFDAPFLLTYIGTSLFVVQLPLHWIYKCWCKTATEHSDYETIPTNLDEGTDDNEGVTVADDDNNYGGEEPSPVIIDEGRNNETLQWTERDHIIAAAKLSPFWFISNFAYNASLEHTSITSSTVLVNTGSLFTFLTALLMRDERFSWWKLMGVAFGMMGCILTARHDAQGNGGYSRRLVLRMLLGDTIDADHYEDEITASGSDDDTAEDLHLWGDILSVISAAFYGIYAVMIRILCPQDESLMSMQLFLGYVGLWNMVVLSPIAIYQLGIARSVTLSAWVFGCIVVNGLFNNVISDYLWARSVVLTSATVATVGLGLTIPLAFASDVFLGVEDVLNIESILGAAFVLTGFILVNVGQTKDNKLDEANRESDLQNEEADGVQSISMQPISLETGFQQAQE